MTRPSPCLHSFFFNDTATTEIYTLSLHDALPISTRRRTIACSRWWINIHCLAAPKALWELADGNTKMGDRLDRKSTRLNSSHQIISYAVFCLKKKQDR